MRVVAYVPDLIDRSRITSVRAQAVFVDDLSGLAAASRSADVVLLDLSRHGVVDAIAGLNAPRVVGFTNHTQRNAMEAARAAGAVAMARSDFFINLEEMIGLED